MKMTTFGPAETNAELKKAVSAAIAELVEKPVLAIVYPSIQADIHGALQIIKAETDIPIIGAITGGAGFTEKGISYNGLVGAFLSGSDVYVNLAAAKNVKNNFDASLSSALTSIKPVGSVGHSLLVLSDAMVDGEKLINFVAKNIPLFWRVWGGLAGDGWKFTGTKVIFNNEILSDAVVFAYINAGIVPSMGVAHGFCPIDGSDEMKITDIDGNILKTIDNKPALDVYSESLIKRGLYKSGDDIMTLLARYPIGMKTFFNQNWRIRTPMSVQGKSLVLAGSIPAGSNIRIMCGDSDTLLSSASETKEAALKGMNGRKVKAQLVIDCAGRKQMLAARYAEQVKAFRASPDCPMLGFTSYGEFARHGGSLEGFHNTTAVTALW